MTQHVEELEECEEVLKFFEVGDSLYGACEHHFIKFKDDLTEAWTH
jgi:hypothetical protein